MNSNRINNKRLLGVQAQGKFSMNDLVTGFRETIYVILITPLVWSCSLRGLRNLLDQMTVIWNAVSLHKMNMSLHNTGQLQSYWWNILHTFQWDSIIHLHRNHTVGQSEKMLQMFDPIKKHWHDSSWSCQAGGEFSTCSDRQSKCNSTCDFK